jgi:hypothetical protein
MKNSKKISFTKLTLNKETLRQLDNRALGQAAGGMINLSRLSCECETSANNRCESFGSAVCP